MKTEPAIFETPYFIHNPTVLHGEFGGIIPFSVTFARQKFTAKNMKKCLIIITLVIFTRAHELQILLTNTELVLLFDLV